MKKQKKAVLIDGEKAIKVTFSTVAYSILIILVLVVMTGSILAYATNTLVGQKIAVGISKVIPFPAAFVGLNSVVYISDVQKDLNSIQQFYLSQNITLNGAKINFNSEDGQKRMRVKEREVLDKLVEDKIIEKLAKQRGINVSDADVNGAVNAKLQEFGTSNDVKNDLLKSFGWTVEDFKQNVVRPGMYTDQLANQINSNINNDQPKEKIQAAQKALLAGQDFAQVVNQYSEGPSKEHDGELGWVSREQVVPELASALFDNALQKNQIIESSIGYHIVEIEGKKTEGNVDLLQLRQIFVAKNTFATWLTQQKKQMRVWIPLHEFFWDTATGSVQFRDPQMIEYEKNVRANAKGDESLLL